MVLLGVVLAGGASRRFVAGDKALYFDPRYDDYWVALAFDKLCRVCDRVVVSVSPRNAAAIQQILPEAELVYDLPPYVGQGPLSALLAASQLADELLTLAVDYPEASTETLSRLMDARNTFISGHYTLSHLAFQPHMLEDFLAQGNRRLRDFLSSLDAQPVAIATDTLLNHNIT